MDSASTTYRPEIDGLRGVAVLAVVLFHARVPGFSGGFVGVDIFFVMSGYLITRLILNEISYGRFSLLGFYERRIRRIMPAMLAMLAVASLAAFVLMPADLKRYGASLVSVAVFLSNLLFWSWSDYFGLTDRATPLLHTWSLSIEEQLYIVFPVLLLLVRKRSRRAIALVIALLALVSFGYSVWAAAADPVRAFYSPLSRIWEFLAGGSLATGMLRPPVRRLSGDAMAGLGLAAIVFAVWRLSAAMPFPGLHALIPCLGTALAIHGAQAPGSLAAKLLSVRPLVGLGLISYSLYLWHWPMMVFGTYYVLNEGWADAVRLAMAGAAVPVAFLSWRYVERPFRGRQGRLSRRALFGWAFSLNAALALAGGALYALDGLPKRFDVTVQRLASQPGQSEFPCANRPVGLLSRDPACILGVSSEQPDFVLWGDSHAAMYHPGLDALARRHGVTGYALTAFGCPPLLDLPGETDRSRTCRQRNREVIALLAAQRPRAVILAAQWSTHLASPAPGEDGEERAARGKHGPGLSPEEARLALDDTLSRLRSLGISIYFVEGIPQSRWSRESLSKAHLLGLTVLPRTGTREYRRRNAEIAALASDLARRGMVRILRPAQLMCDTRGCAFMRNGVPLYFDGSHLSPEGAYAVSPAFEPVMTELTTNRARRDRRPASD